MNLKEWANQKIHDIQNGDFDRSNFPETMMGEIAKSKWNDVMFHYGMEYGYLLAMVELKDRINVRY